MATDMGEHMAIVSKLKTEIQKRMENLDDDIGDDPPEALRILVMQVRPSCNPTQVWHLSLAPITPARPTHVTSLLPPILPPASRTLTGVRPPSARSSPRPHSPATESRAEKAAAGQRRLK